MLFSLLLVLSLASCYSDIDFKPAEITDNTKPSNPSPSNPNPTPGEADDPVDPNNPVEGVVYLVTKDSDYSREFKLSVMNIPSTLQNISVVLSNNSENYTYNIPRNKNFDRNDYLLNYTINGSKDESNEEEPIEPGKYSLSVFGDGDPINSAAGTPSIDYTFEEYEPSQVTFKMNSSDTNKYAIEIANTPYAEDLVIYATTEDQQAEGEGTYSAGAISNLKGIDLVNTNLPYKKLKLENGEIKNQIEGNNSGQDPKIFELPSDGGYVSFVFEYGYPHYRWYQFKFETPKLIVTKSITKNDEENNGKYYYDAKIYNFPSDDTSKVKLGLYDESTKILKELSTSGLSIVENSLISKDGIITCTLEFDQNIAMRSDYYNANTSKATYILKAIYDKDGNSQRETNTQTIQRQFNSPQLIVSKPNNAGKGDYVFEATISDFPAGYDSVRLYGVKRISSNMNDNSVKNSATENGAAFYVDIILNDSEKAEKTLYPILIDNDYLRSYGHGNIEDGSYYIVAQFGNNRIYNNNNYKIIGNRLLSYSSDKEIEISLEQLNPPAPDKLISANNTYDGNIKVTIKNARNKAKKIEIEIMGYTKPSNTVDVLVSATLDNLIALSSDSNSSISDLSLKTYYYGTGEREDCWDPENPFKFTEEDDLNDLKKDGYGLLKPIYNVKTDTLVFSIPNNYYGRFLVRTKVTDFANENNIIENILDEKLDIYANQYNIALLEFTVPTTLFAEYYMFNTSDGEPQGRSDIPTVMSVSRYSGYNWNELTHYKYWDEDKHVDHIHRNPKVKLSNTGDQSWAINEEGKTRLDIELVNLMNEYVQDLIQMQKDHGIKDTEYNFFFSDFSPEFTLALVYANGLTPSTLSKESWANYQSTKCSVTYLSSGRETYDYLEALNNHDLNTIKTEWNTFKAEAIKVGEFFSSSNATMNSYYDTAYSEFKASLYERLENWRKKEADIFGSDNLHGALPFHILAAIDEPSTTWRIGNVSLFEYVIGDETLSGWFNEERGKQNIIESNPLARIKTLKDNKNGVFDKFLKVLGIDWDSVKPKNGEIPVLFIGRVGDYKQGWYSTGYNEKENPYYLKEYMQITQKLFTSDKPKDGNNGKTFKYYYIGDRVDYENNGNSEPENELKELNGVEWTILDSAIIKEVYGGLFIYDNNTSNEMKIVGYPESFFWYLPGNLGEETGYTKNIEYAIVSNFDQFNKQDGNGNFTKIDFNSRLLNINDFVHGDLKAIIMNYGWREEEQSEPGSPNEVDKVAGNPIKPNSDYDNYNYFSVYLMGKDKKGFKDQSYIRNTHKPDINGKPIKEYTYSDLFSNEADTEEEIHGNENEFNRIEFIFERNTGNFVDWNFYNRIIKFENTTDEVSLAYYVITKGNDVSAIELENKNEESTITYSPVPTDVTRKPSNGSVQSVGYIERNLDYVQFEDDNNRSTINYYVQDSDRQVILIQGLPDNAIVVIEYGTKTTGSNYSKYYIGRAINGRFAFNDFISPGKPNENVTSDNKDGEPVKMVDLYFSGTMRIKTYLTLSESEITQGMKPIVNYPKEKKDESDYINQYLYKDANKHLWENLLYFKEGVDPEYLSYGYLDSIANTEYRTLDQNGRSVVVDFYEFDSIDNNSIFEIGVYDSNNISSAITNYTFKIDPSFGSANVNVPNSDLSLKFTLPNNPNKEYHKYSSDYVVPIRDIPKGGVTFIPQNEASNHQIKFPLNESNHYYLTFNYGGDTYYGAVEIVDGVLSIKTPIMPSIT